MFKFFKKKSEVDKLQKRYEKLMNEWHTLSATNRAESDKKFAEATNLQKRIEDLVNQI
ncbi:Lacal_2735 family protein [Psychroserpens sp.]|uniref:Lacal_2735 family protein n=1 Tax=Psychroserpens sp. TaxID=2020870 RepID=UPI00385C8274